MANSALSSGDSLRLFAEYTYSQREAEAGRRAAGDLRDHRRREPVQPLRRALVDDLRVSASSSLVRTGDRTDDLHAPGHRRERRPSAAWSWEAYAFRSRDSSKPSYPSGVQNTDQIDAAFASSDPATAFNPFTPGGTRRAPASKLASSRPSATATPARSTSPAPFVRGPLAQLPAGPLEIVVRRRSEPIVAELLRQPHQPTG
jgi:hypothetical protein